MGDKRDVGWKRAQSLSSTLCVTASERLHTAAPPSCSLKHFSRQESEKRRRLTHTKGRDPVKKRGEFKLKKHTRHNASSITSVCIETNKNKEKEFLSSWEKRERNKKKIFYLLLLAKGRSSPPPYWAKGLSDLTPFPYTAKQHVKNVQEKEEPSYQPAAGRSFNRKTRAITISPIPQ